MTTTTVETSELLTLREVADVLHVSPVTAWRLTRRGALRSLLIPSGRGDRPMIRVERDALVDYIVEANRDRAAMRRVDVAAGHTTNP